MIPAEQVPLVASGLAFLAILLFSIGILYYFRYRATRQRLIEKIQQDGETPNARVLSSHSGAPAGAREQVLHVFGSIGRRVKPEKLTELRQGRLEFLKAGIRRENALPIFWGVKCVLGLLMPMSFMLVKMEFFKLLNASLFMLLSFLLAFIGFYLPDVWLRFKTSARRERIQDGIPDALDLLVVCVEAGMGLDAAIQRVGEELKLTNRELSDELKLLNLEMRAGKTRRDALRHFALRTDLEDLNSLVTLLIQTDKFGTSIAQALRVHSDASRTKRTQRAEEIAAKLPVKLVLPLVAFIFPSLFVTILAPAAIRIFHAIIKQ